MEIDIAFAVIIWLLGFSYFSLKKYRHSFVILSIYIWHSLFCLVYYFQSLKAPVDSNVYYAVGLSRDCSVGFGTELVVLISCVSSKLNLGYLSQFLVFNMLGSLGLVFIYQCMNARLGNSPKVYAKTIFVLIFLPSISYWTTAIGKDSIFFLGLGLAVRPIFIKNKGPLMIFVGIFVMGLVRPHMALVALVAIICAYMVNSHVGAKIKIPVILLSITGVYFSLGFVANYVGLGATFDVSLLGAYVESRQASTMIGNTALDISKMGLPEQVFTYLFRPLPHEATNILTLASSLENVILLILAAVHSYYLIKYRSRIFSDIHTKFLVTFGVVYSILGLLILATTTANLGIALRQKWMIVPIVFIVSYNIIIWRKKRI